MDPLGGLRTDSPAAALLEAAGCTPANSQEERSRCARDPWAYGGDSEAWQFGRGILVFPG